MALFQVDIEKRIGTEYWTNVYYVTADTLFAADTAAVRIAAMEQDFHRSSVVFVKARTRTPVKGDDIFINTPLGMLGDVAELAVERLPLFNVCRVDFGAATGRPSRKYYRLPMQEGDVSGGNISPALVTMIQTAWQGMVADIGANGMSHVDIDGQAIMNCTVNLAMGMRQLRRGKRRRQTPVLP